MCHTRVKLAINGPGMSLMAEKKRRQTQRVRMAALTNPASCGRLRPSNSVKPPIAQLAVKHGVSSAALRAWAGRGSAVYAGSCYCNPVVLVGIRYPR